MIFCGQVLGNLSARKCDGFIVKYTHHICCIYGETKLDLSEQLREKKVQFGPALGSALLGLGSARPAKEPSGLSLACRCLGVSLARPAKQPAQPGLGLD